MSDKEKQTFTAKDYMIEEDLTPEDLKLVVSNESGGFVIFESKSDKRLYSVYLSKGAYGEKMHLVRLSSGSTYRKCTEEEAKQFEN